MSDEGLERRPGAETEAEDADTARLVERFQAGEREAFATIYTRYFARVYNYLRVALDDPDEAEDLAQQSFTNALEALPRYERRPGLAFRHWLFSLVRREAIHELRKRSRTEVMDPEEIDRLRDRGEEDEGALQMLDWLSDGDLAMFVERLTLVQRQVLVLRYIFDMPYAEIAANLGRTPTDVRSLHSRAVRFLRDRLTALGRRSEGDGGRANMRSPIKQPPVISARRWSL